MHCNSSLFINLPSFTRVPSSSLQFKLVFHRYSWQWRMTHRNRWLRREMVMRSSYAMQQQWWYNVECTLNRRYWCISVAGFGMRGSEIFIKQWDSKSKVWLKKITHIHLLYKWCTFIYIYPTNILFLNSTRRHNLYSKLPDPNFWETIVLNFHNNCKYLYISVLCFAIFFFIILVDFLLADLIKVVNTTYSWVILK